MARPNPIRAIMASPLPSITYQRRKQFRPNAEGINYAYMIINKYVFNNQLKKPKILVKQLPRQWGNCLWDAVQHPGGSSCIITLVPNWFSVHWFMNTLAHEMVHQYQWDVYRFEHEDYYGRPMYENSGAHGPSFFAWREQFEYYDLHLKTYFGQKRWFKYQDFTKC
jgi:hypothetical protein